MSASFKTDTAYLSLIFSGFRIRLKRSPSSRVQIQWNLWIRGMRETGRARPDSPIVTISPIPEVRLYGKNVFAHSKFPRFPDSRGSTDHICMETSH